MSNVTAPREAVVFIHGLWMNRLSMGYLALALKRSGFSPACLGFRSTRGSLAEHAAALSEGVAKMPGEVVHLVGHSMGGLVALQYLRGSRDPRIGRIVMLGTPVAGCSAARDLARWTVGRLLLGRSIEVWQSEFTVALVPTDCVGVIAGCKALGLGSALMRVPRPCDGVVSVAETRAPGLADHLVLPVSHTGMLISRDVALQTSAFLRNGRFRR